MCAMPASTPRRDSNAQDQVDAAEQELETVVTLRLQSLRALADLVHIAAERDAASARLEDALASLAAASRQRAA